MNSRRLRVTEIFYSLQGESVTTGLPTVFVRLTGCPLRCQYCDTAYAFHNGTVRLMDDVIHEILGYSCQHVCITGGEPMAQPNCVNLMHQLCDAGLSVSIETSGARDIRAIDPRVMIVMDLKTPGSGESDKNMLSNLEYLKLTDQIKFVICDETDYQWACVMLQQHQLAQKAHVLFSPSWQQLDHVMLAEWILRDKLPVRFQLQLHKILWQDQPGR